MEINITIGDYEKNQLLKNAVHAAIESEIMPYVKEHIKNAVSTDEVGKIILNQIRSCFEYSQYNTNHDIYSLSGMIQARVEEVAKGITDQELKDLIVHRFFANLNK